MDPATAVFVVQGLRILAEYAQEAQSGVPMTSERLQYFHDQWLESDQALQADIARAKAEGR